MNKHNRVKTNKDLLA